MRYAEVPTAIRPCDHADRSGSPVHRPADGPVIRLGMYGAQPITPISGIPIAVVARCEVQLRDYAESMDPIVARALRCPARLYDWNAGWILGRRFRCLTHTGRRTGRQYRTMLEVIGENPVVGEVIVLAGLGRSAQWYRNVVAGKATDLVPVPTLPRTG